MKLSLKKLLPGTLMGRSLLILVTPVLLLQVITTFIFFDRHWSKMTDRLAFAVAGEIAVIAGQIENGAPPERIQQMARYAAQNLDLLISFENDGVLEDTSRRERRSMVGKTLQRALDAQVRRPHVINIDIEEKWVEVSLQLDNGVLRISLPQRRLFSSSGYIFLLWMIGSSIILLAIAILFMRNQIRPIRRLAIVAERFGKGQDIPQSFKPEGAREIRQAAHAFLEMRKRIKRQVEQRTVMLAGVSHDLRTPLTRMKLQTAMLGDSPDIAALNQDIADMQRMIDAYLDFARGQGDEQAERTDLEDMMRQITAPFEGGDIGIEKVIEKDLIVSVRPVAFKRGLANLLNNACKYAKRIRVEMKRRNDVIFITIDDNGPGIPEDQYEEVFKPFYRVEESRNPATGGVGLGLPIAQDIILAHGGKIGLSASPLGGLRVSVEIPV